LASKFLFLLRNRLQIFHANLIKNIKDNISISKNADYDAKKVVTEYSEKDEKLVMENDKLVSELHHIIEKNRNNKQVVIERIKTRIRQDFEKFTQEAAKAAQKSNQENFEVVCVGEGDNYTKPISKDTFLHALQEGYTNKLRQNLESHKLAYDNFEDIYQRRKYLFVDIQRQQDELFSMLNSVNFDLAPEERVLFDKE